MTKIAAAAVVLSLALLGCSTTPKRPAEGSVSVARGPCFGFCPVYEIRMIGDDRVGFSGIRHTAVLGEIVKPVNRAALAGVRARLAAYRPGSGSSHFDCPNEVSDQAEYTNSWQAPGAGTASELIFNSGCQSTEGRKLKSILDDLPATLNLETESRQVTRPGASRG